MRIQPAAAAFILSLGLIETPAFAEDTGTAEPAKSDEIVVTASAREQRVIDAPASITVVTSELLAKRPMADLTDALRDVEGINVTGASNTRDITMRGMPGQYTLIMVDSVRQSTRDSRTNGTGGYEQSFTPPAAAIERIEVVRGPMSTLYGSDAIGGVINIITRTIPDSWGGSVGADYVVQEHGDSGNWVQGQYYLAGPVVADTLGVQTWGRIYRRGEDDIVSGNYGARDYNLTGRLAWRPAPGQEVLLEGNTTRVKRVANAGATLADTGTSNYNITRRNAGTLRWNADWEALTSAVSLLRESSHYRSYTADDDGGYTRATRNPRITNTVLDALINLPLDNTPLGDHHLAFGGQYIWNRLVDINPGLRDNLERTYTIWQRALFLEDEWQLADGFALTGGLRFDDHQVYGGHWSPRLYAVWNPASALTLKGGVSTGFRAPEIRVIAPGYAYTTGGSSCTYGADGTCGVIISDPDLKAETSTNYEVNVLYHPSPAFSLGGTAFRTEFRNKIQSALVYEEDGSIARWSEDTNYRLYYNYNVGRSRSQGFEVTARWKPIERLSLKAGYTYTDSKQQTGDYAGYPLTQTPKHMANARADFDVTQTLALWTSLTYRGEEINAGLRTGSNGRALVNAEGTTVGRIYPDYFQADIGGVLRLREAVSLKLGIYNLTDKRLDVADYNMQGDGRRYWMGINVDF
ncbi:TonB-dependent receptor [Novosphingobium sp. 1949]|uniref:TonB-dependent receptor n=1 Tax=Novosphingobium organovorum TaxID=2930092 RepID=A0ABT0BEM4_9SPHN|nr:TonB-dependent receptor [Novosphingobium organovorum]MCJ2183531.1 TonB-dependent receptor [Novosphingobium organovorum]